MPFSFAKTFLISKGCHHYGSQCDRTERVWSPGVGKLMFEARFKAVGKLYQRSVPRFS